LFNKIHYTLFIVLLCCCGGYGCSHYAQPADRTSHAIYMVRNDRDTLVSRFSPVFLIQDHGWEYNRIGKPSARFTPAGAEEIYVDPKHPVIYYRVINFKTEKGEYTNYIYRVHFPEIPFSLFPFHLTAGKNVGLMIVVTVNRLGMPILVTSVHTCGCYCAIIPTSELDLEMLPDNWGKGPLDVYGETLPHSLSFNANKNQKLIIHLRSEVHRVMDLEIREITRLENSSRQHAIKTDLMPAKTLNHITLNGTHTSFYYKTGLLKGHVKGSVKFWETLFMGLTSLDFFVGTDKEYNSTELTDNPFYTSLKPWNRDASDMWYFERFLKFWGWKL